jgi:DNA primase
MIDRITIDRIFDAVRIADVVSDFVTLRKRGVNFVGLCPFHDDSKPSFYVSPSKNICKCFSCGEGGTAVQFIMKHEQVSYPEALRYLAKKYNIEFSEKELTEEEKQSQSDRESMFILNGWAQKFFSSQLYDSEEGRNVGLSYFSERGFRDAIIRKFQLGYSPARRDGLYENAVTHGFNRSYLIKTGLASERSDGKVYDRFHGRVIFPVHTVSGKVVAFGGRILVKSDKAAKYVNSPESEIYHKSNELYGIFFARQAIAKADKCYLVEGYTDVISMHQNGVENVVASSGTALTYGQIRLIRRFTPNITVLYDGDTAGIKAALRGIDMFLEEGMNVKVVLLPEGEDPDSFSRKYNSFDFMRYINASEVDFIRFKTGLLLKDSDNDPIKRATLIKDIISSIAVIPDPIIRSAYIKECSQQLEEKEQVLINEILKLRENRRTRTAPHVENKTNKAAADGSAPVGDAPQDDNTAAGNKSAASPQGIIEQSVQRAFYPYRKYESSLIGYIIKYGDYVIYEVEEEEEVKTSITVTEYIQYELLEDDLTFQIPVFRQILDEAIEECKKEDFVASNYFLTHHDLTISRIASEILSDKYQLSKMFDIKEEEKARINQTEEDIEKDRLEKERQILQKNIVNDIFSLKYAYIKKKIDEVNKLIKSSQSDDERVTELLRQRMNLDLIKNRLSKELGERIVVGV